MMRLPTPIAIAVGAIVGVLARWAVFEVLSDDVGVTRTVIVNGFGCLLMGVFIHRNWRDDFRTAATEGLCGGLTTFSTFALDAAVYLEEARWAAGALYVGATAVASVAAYAIGRQAIREPV